MALPNLIIGGPPKAGTTSAFRYLSDHPDVCPSSIKEIHFFYEFKSIDTQAMNHYESYFKRCETRNPIRLEASARYLQGGKPIAKLIRSYLPDVKLIFILREPVARFFSRYISLRTKTDRIPSHMGLDELVDAILTHPQAIPDAELPHCEEEMLEYLWQGCYSKFLEEYFKLFSNKAICISFFDELSQQPREFMTNICKFAGITSDYYNEYQFRVENKTRIVRHTRFHKTAEMINRRLEWLQNRYPALRRMIRDIYYGKINPEIQDKDSVITDYAADRLKEYYASMNDELRELLQKEYPEISLPGWLDNTNGSQLENVSHDSE